MAATERYMFRSTGLDNGYIDEVVTGDLYTVRIYQEFVTSTGDKFELFQEANAKCHSQADAFDYEVGRGLALGRAWQRLGRKLEKKLLKYSDVAHF